MANNYFSFLSGLINVLPNKQANKVFVVQEFLGSQIYVLKKFLHHRFTYLLFLVFEATRPKHSRTVDDSFTTFTIINCKDYAIDDILYKYRYKVFLPQSLISCLLSLNIHSSFSQILRLLFHLDQNFVLPDVLLILYLFQSPSCSELHPRKILQI